MHDYTRANLDSQTRTMLDFASRLTREPHSMRESNVQELREAGFSDEQILSIVLITCTFNFMTRLADGLGVELEPAKEEDMARWLLGPATELDWLVKAHA